MRIAVWPFYSQQDKVTGRHLPTCGNVQRMSWLANRLTDMGHDVIAIVPEATEMPFRCETFEQRIPSDNPSQRLSWDMGNLPLAFAGADTILCNHEFGPIPARVAAPNARIVQMTSVPPEPLSFFTTAWQSSDLVVVQSEFMRRYLSTVCPTPVVKWAMTYDADRLPQVPTGASYLGCERPYDVCFIQRGSASNYSHHEEFIACLPSMTHFNVLILDPTGYIKLKYPDLTARFPNVEFASNPHDPSYYRAYLLGSKVVVSLCGPEFASQSVREAVRCGCIPVLLDHPASHEVVGEDWPMFAKDLTQLGYVVRKMPCEEMLDEMRARVAAESYQCCMTEVMDGLLG